MIKSQCNCCPLVLRFCSRKWKSKVNIVQERALRVTYKNNKNDFQTLLYENNETSVHQRNLQFLMKEIFIKLITTRIHPLYIVYSSFAKTLSI